MHLCIVTHPSWCSPPSLLVLTPIPPNNLAYPSLYSHPSLPMILHIHISTAAIDEQNLQTLKYEQESKIRREEDEEPDVAFKQSNIEPDNREPVFFQRSMNIPIITTDSADDDGDDADDEDDYNCTPHYLQALPNRMQMASLLVPSFGFYSSSEGESSACSTPGQVTPARSRSPAPSSQLGKINI